MTDEPKGKRTLRRTRYGNLVGYIGCKRWELINGCGIDEYTEAEAKAAAAWVAGREDWQKAAWE